MASRSRRWFLFLAASSLCLPLVGAQADEGTARPDTRIEARPDTREGKTWREGELRGQRGAGKVRGGAESGFKERSALDGVVDGILGVGGHASRDR